MLPWDILLMLVTEYFHPPEALIALRLCRRLNAALQQPIKGRLIRDMLIYVYKEKEAEQAEQSSQYRCDKCNCLVPKTSRKKHLMKHDKRKFYSIVMDKCHECGVEHPLNGPHDCPCHMYDCMDNNYQKDFPWTKDICTECPMPKKRWDYIKHDVYVQCLECEEIFKVQNWDKDYRDWHQYIWHWEECPYKDKITAEHGPLVTPDPSED
jgi:hypothetical protein